MTNYSPQVLLSGRQTSNSAGVALKWKKSRPSQETYTRKPPKVGRTIIQPNKSFRTLRTVTVVRGKLSESLRRHLFQSEQNGRRPTRFQEGLLAAGSVAKHARRLVQARPWKLRIHVRLYMWNLTKRHRLLGKTKEPVKLHPHVSAILALFKTLSILCTDYTSSHIAPLPSHRR